MPAKPLNEYHHGYHYQSDRRQFPSSESARLRVALRLVLSILRPPLTEGQQVSRRLVKELFFYAVLCTCGDRDVHYERGFQIWGIWVSIVCPHLRKLRVRAVGFLFLGHY